MIHENILKNQGFLCWGIGHTSFKLKLGSPSLRCQATSLTSFLWVGASAQALNAYLGSHFSAPAAGCGWMWTMVQKERRKTSITACLGEWESLKKKDQRRHDFIRISSNLHSLRSANDSISLRAGLSHCWRGTFTRGIRGSAACVYITYELMNPPKIRSYLIDPDSINMYKHVNMYI